MKEILILIHNRSIANTIGVIPVKMRSFHRWMKLKKINQIFEFYFISFKKYSLRLDYSFEEYERKTIVWNFKRLRRFIWITLRAWFVIISLFIIIQWPRATKFGIHHLDARISIDRYDLLYGHILILTLVLEIASYRFLRLLFCYDLRMNRTLRNLIEFDRNGFDAMPNDILDSLIKNHLMLALFLRISYNLVHIALILMHLYFFCDWFLEYLSNRLGLVQMITVIAINHQLYRQSFFITGQLLFDIFSFSFVGKYYLKKFQHFVELFRKTFTNDYGINKMKRIHLIRNFHRFCCKYVEQSYEIASWNHSVRGSFFIIETFSKCSMIFLVLFYEGQTKINMLSLLIICLGLDFSAILVCFLAKISTFDTLNGVLSRSMLSQQSRIYSERFRLKSNDCVGYKNDSTTNRFALNDEIRRNFFVQNIASNPMGFSCGNIFHITKFKYFEMQSLNCVLILLFYKRFFLFWSNRLIQFC